MKYLPILIISLIIPAIFLFVTKDIGYNTPESNPPSPDALYISGKGWPIPIYEVTESGGITGRTTGPYTRWDVFVIEFLVLFIATFSIGTLAVIITNNLKHKK